MELLRHINIIMDYSQGKIYKIVCDELEECYVGSTRKTLEERLKNHYGCYKHWLITDTQYYTSFDILQYDSARIELVESYPCASKKDLLRREKYWILLLNTVNKKLPSHTKAEYRERYRESIREKDEKRIPCICGRYYKRNHKTRHLKSTVHLLNTSKAPGNATDPHQSNEVPDVSPQPQTDPCSN